MTTPATPATPAAPIAVPFTPLTRALIAPLEARARQAEHDLLLAVAGVAAQAGHKLGELVAMTDEHFVITLVTDEAPRDAGTDACP